MPPLPDNTALRAFWADFSAQWKENPDPNFYEAFYFSDNKQDADELGKLVLAGTKRATASLQAAYAAQKKPMPFVGALSIVTNWDGAALCIIETAKLDLVPFDRVSAEFAAAEGEGDMSLSYWSQGHRRYFSRECVQLGMEFSDDMLILCEHFRVVYPRAD
jgi:uncharacterized protein YhfF